MEKFEMVAKTFQGLEDVLRDELIALGAENVEIGTRMVTFTGTNEMLYKANLCCRTALRILKPVFKFSAKDPDELYDAVRDIEWDRLMGPDSTFAIDSTVNSAEFTHSKFVTYRVKDGIADYFSDKYGRRPSIRVAGADLLFNVHISDSRVTISLDSSGEPLSRRGYRTEQTEAPLNEVLAAGIILKTGWRGDTNFYDPMCGSGTFLTEAALIAANINPGIYRSSFAFEKWPDFDADLFESIYNDDSGERTYEYKIYGSDIDPEAIAIARRNIRSARVEDMVELDCRPFQDIDGEAPLPGILISNPPYGKRLRPDDLETSLFEDLGKTLKFHFKGYNAWLLGYTDEQFARIGLKPSVKFPILNGSLECQLREYVLFDGKLEDFKREGGSTRNDDFNRESRPRTRHLSDEEWRREERRFGGRDRNKKREFRSEFKREDRKRDERRRGEFRRDDRKRDDRRRDDYRGGARRDNGKGFQSRVRKDYPDDMRRYGRNAGTPRSQAIETQGRGPALPESSTVFRAGENVKMRSRKSFYRRPEKDEDTES